MFAALEGKKTYILACLAIAVAIIQRLGWISQEDMTTILALLGGSATLTVRSAIARIPKETQQEIAPRLSVRPPPNS